ncbi:hypothetical protein DPEC_G00280820 [Dallia pectoralis]|uniref:Uncharacterized protein n=1 Tax=Dallia pectoralis TaxID=75939 RepID=A0ACC2FN51_DALPE|nr:hypothetical protein DPEC_G00280820 [Dallia pectoralis]
MSGQTSPIISLSCDLTCAVHYFSSGLQKIHLDREQANWTSTERLPLKTIMLILLAGIFLLHLTGIILLLVATIDNAWWVTNTMSTDVWSRWILDNGIWNNTVLPTSSSYPSEYLQAVQASSILACIFSILGLFVFVGQLFTLAKGQRFTFSGIFQLLACLCIMIAASIYTDIFHKSESSGWYGHCFILAWISFAFTFISSIIYFVLRKKTRE